jgi:hypothetical protein
MVFFWQSKCEAWLAGQVGWQVKEPSNHRDAKLALTRRKRNARHLFISIKEMGRD